METDHFINNGYGWVCKHCLPSRPTHGSQSDEPASEADGRARFFNEGEAEDKEPALSATALARWRDASRQTLLCPRCGIEEQVNKTTR